MYDTIIEMFYKEFVFLADILTMGEICYQPDCMAAVTFGQLTRAVSVRFVWR